MTRGRRAATAPAVFAGGCTTCDEYESMVRQTCGVMDAAAYRDLMATCPGMTPQKLHSAVRNFRCETALLSRECRLAFDDLPFTTVYFATASSDVDAGGFTGGFAKSFAKSFASVTSSAKSADFDNVVFANDEFAGGSTHDVAEDVHSHSHSHSHSHAQSQLHSHTQSQLQSHSRLRGGSSGSSSREGRKNRKVKQKGARRKKPHKKSRGRKSSDSSSDSSRDASTTTDAGDNESGTDSEGSGDAKRHHHKQTAGKGVQRKRSNSHTQRQRAQLHQQQLHQQQLQPQQQQQPYAQATLVQPVARPRASGRSASPVFEAARPTYTYARKTASAGPGTTAETPNWPAECPLNYDARLGCVVDPVIGECIPPQEIAGDVTGAQFSDGYCYNSARLQMHARAQHAAGAKNLNLPSGRTFTRADLDKLDKTRLATYCHQTLLHSISSAVAGRVDATSREQDQAYEAFLEHLRAENVPKAEENRVWAMFKSGVSTATKLATGALRALMDVGKWLAGKALSLGTFIASNPRMARMFLIVVKGLVGVFCQRMAIMLGKAKYKYKGMMTQMGEALTGDLASAAADQGIASFFSGAGIKKLVSGVGSVASAIAGEIPGLSAVVAGVSAVVDIVAEPATEAMKFAAELALYQKDMNASFASVLDLMRMVVNPLKCMDDNAEVTTSDEALDGKAIESRGITGLLTSQEDADAAAADAAQPQAAHQAAQQAAQQAARQAAEQAAQQAAEQAAQQATRQAAEQAAEQSAQQAAEQAAASDEASAPAKSTSWFWGGEHDTTTVPRRWVHAPGPPRGPRSWRRNDAYAQPGDRSRDKSRNKSRNKANDKANDKSTDKSTDKAANKPRIGSRHWKKF